jgi:hypothetical protein
MVAYKVKTTKAFGLVQNIINMLHFFSHYDSFLFGGKSWQ